MFPNHHPDPTEKKNLAGLKALDVAKPLDFGMAFDGDGDRIGTVAGRGRVIWGGWLLLCASNTQDALVALAKSADQAGLDRLLAQIDAQPAASGLTRGRRRGTDADQPIGGSSPIAASGGDGWTAGTAATGCRVAVPGCFLGARVQSVTS